MFETIVTIIFFLWYLASLIISENAGKKSKLGTEWLFFISMIGSPVIGVLLAIFGTKKGK
ncbi:MAG: hypothetical protein K8R53_05910 [Bacteroidales bacterium]|nr:hypothetical protein [Bacteroidales bacterium]